MSIKISKHSGVYILQAMQQLNCTADKAWSYFSLPENLQAITPEKLNFRITSGMGKNIYQGQIITYKISFFKVFTFSWVTEITVVQPPRIFVDEQRKGPYALWHHEHHFTPNENGVQMVDKVTYKLPFGWIGNAIAGKMINKQVMDIFLYRYTMLEKIFNKPH